MQHMIATSIISLYNIIQYAKNIQINSLLIILFMGLLTQSSDHILVHFEGNCFHFVRSCVL